MACESIQQTLTELQAQQKALQAQLAKAAGAEKAALVQALAKLEPQIASTEADLKKCQGGQTTTSNPPPPPPAPAPASILDIISTFPDTQANMAAKRNSYLSSIGTNKFPQNVAREWVQPLSPDQDYDDLIVSCTGWMVNPRDNGNGDPAYDMNQDFPFSHPFGADWEFSVALDKPANAGGQFDYLLTPGNKVNPAVWSASDQKEQIIDEQAATTLKLDFPLGLLGVEMDGLCVPTQFKTNVASGNRVALFGRWIVDTGHPMHRAEIHPPLLMATASTTAPDTTRAIFTSRPFLVQQLYTTDQSSVYVDSGSNDGTFYGHLINEIVKINELRSTLIECHPKVCQKPMRGLNLMRIQVRPPAPKTTVIGVAPQRHLSLSYHFTVRTGVAVQITSSAADTVDVWVALNSANYSAPPLPHNAGYRYSQSQLEANPDVGNDYWEVEALSAAIHALLPGTVIASAVIAAFFARGVQGDFYDSQTNAVNPLTTSGAVTNITTSNIQANAGVTVDDNQPYPVTGWLEVKWVENQVVAEPTAATQPAKQPITPVTPVKTS
jgi:hypothetical protein